MNKVRNLLRSLTVNDEEQLPTPSPIVVPATPPCSPGSCPSPSASSDKEFVFQPEGHPKQAIIDGEIWPPIFKAEFVRSAKRLVPQKDDVFVCTFPKCGTTWIQHICGQLMLNDYAPEAGKVKELAGSSPMIERMGSAFVSNLQHPRLLKTHFSFKNCPKGATKYIYCVRNPKDCLTSYFHHNRNFKIYDWADGEFDIFFELFASGQLGFGDYFDHLLGWLPHMNDENLLFLRYEDMYADLEAAVVKIGHFLGGRAEEIVNDPEQLAKVVAESRLSSMQKKQGRWFPQSILHTETFVRKGGSRDWKNHMTREQSDRLDTLIQQRLAGTPAATWWQSEMAWEEVEAEAEVEIPETAIIPESTLIPHLLEPVDEGVEADIKRRHSFSIRGSCPAEVVAAVAAPTKPERTGSLESLTASAASSGYNSLISSNYTSSDSLSHGAMTGLGFEFKIGA